MTMKTLTCPKCGADYSNKHIRPGAPTFCLSCPVMFREDDGVLIRLTAEEMEVWWKSFIKVPPGKNDYEDSDQR
jgi:hypothetical protein